MLKKCPECGSILYNLTMTHPWRLYCPHCREEVAPEDAQDYFVEVKRIKSI